MGVRPINLADLHPDLQERVKDLLAKLRLEGITVFKTSGSRGFKEQAELYKKYRTAHGNPAAPAGLSRHQPFYEGRSGAVDLGLSLSLPKDKRKKQYARIGVLAKGLGLIWGGDFSSPEPWHVELKGLDPWKEYLLSAALLDRMKGFCLRRKPGRG